MSEKPIYQDCPTPRASPFRAEALRQLEYPIASQAPLIKPTPRIYWATIGVVLLATALIAAAL